jgi:hypothetical protein
MSGLGTSRTSALKIDKCLCQLLGSLSLKPILLNGGIERNRRSVMTAFTAGQDRERFLSDPIHF